MSDEMPNTIYTTASESTGRIYGHLGKGKGRIQYHRTDWLRSQIEKLMDIDTGYPERDAVHMKALDQILNLLETGEKK